jgi:hypothetical protein
VFSLKPDISGIKRKFHVSALGMALCCGMVIGEAHADSTCGLLSATYLLTALNSDGSFAARQLLTLTEDRNVIVDDSAQGGVTNVFNPFTTAQGTWECESRSSPIQADATALFFSLPGSVSGGQTIGRIDYEITLHAVSKSISGTIDLRFFPLTGNPLATPLPAPNATFTFTGVRVTN